MKMLTEHSLNYHADTIEEAKDYIYYRNKQLLKFGVIAKQMIELNDSIVVRYDTSWNEEVGAIYLLNSARGKGRYKELRKEYNIQTIVTLEECKIADYLYAKEIDSYVFNHSNAYKAISNFYGDDRAKRSGVPLMYHIDEGGAILEKLGSSDEVKDAYYLHPLYQMDDYFNRYKHTTIEGVRTSSIILAMEYRWVANSYLSTKPKSNFAGFTCPEVRDMLIADKVQNYKDFLVYHFGTHPKSNELDKYFNNWFDLLEIKFDDYRNLIED